MHAFLRDAAVAVLTAVISIFGTLALAGGVPRAEVERMIAASEQRTAATIMEMKSDQREMLVIVQQMRVDLARVAAKSSKDE